METTNLIVPSTTSNKELLEYNKFVIQNIVTGEVDNDSMNFLSLIFSPKQIPE